MQLLSEIDKYKRENKKLTGSLWHNGSKMQCYSNTLKMFALNIVI